MDARRVYDEIAVTYEQRKQALEPAEWSERLFDRWVGSLPSAAAVLDLGCGHGFEVERMAGAGLRPVGLDLSLGMLRLAKGRVAGRLVQADAARLPLRAAALDGVWSLHTMLHVDDLSAVLAEVARVLKPDGLVALTLALGNDGTTIEPVSFQAGATRRFVHRTHDEAMVAVETRFQVLASGSGTDGRATLWLLLARLPGA